ncbi:MAG: PqqD family protein [Caldilineales bacterium]|nr:PqqD family protein [Caldilineales bacterium]
MDIQDSAQPQRSKDAASRVFDGEAVIISPSLNMVRMLNPVATRIWESADGNHTIANIANHLTSEFAVEYDHAVASTRRFLQELADKGLVTLHNQEQKMQD